MKTFREQIFPLSLGADKRRNTYKTALHRKTKKCQLIKRLSWPVVKRDELKAINASARDFVEKACQLFTIARNFFQTGITIFSLGLLLDNKQSASSSSSSALFWYTKHCLAFLRRKREVVFDKRHQKAASLSSWNDADCSLTLRLLPKNPKRFGAVRHTHVHTQHRRDN